MWLLAAAVATEYEEYLAVEAKKRQLSTLKQNQLDTVKENLPERSSAQASDEAGQMLGVSGRSVRDAKAVKKADPERFPISGSNVH